MKYCSYLLMAVTLLYMLAKKIEVPAFFAFFFISAGINRYDTIVNKKTAGFVSVQNWDIFVMNADIALEVLNLMFIGTLLICVLTMLFTSNLKRENHFNTELFRSLLLKYKSQIIYFVVFFLFLSFIGIRLVGSGGYLYVLIFIYAIGSMVLFAFYYFFNRKNYINIALCIASVFVAYSLFDPFMRFTFLAWVVPLAIVLLNRFSIFKRSLLFLIGLPIGLLLFNIGGLIRVSANKKLSTGELVQLAIKRIQSSEDANMLDGFMMSYQVYPNLLPYQYGIAHLEFFTRPIPRALWPGKPVGGYANKLGLNDKFDNFTIGISESIFGTFYSEIGIIGLIFFCFIYSYFFAYYYRLSFELGGILGDTIKGLILSFAVIVSRGGDIPGIYANFIMAYIPVLLFIYQFNKQKKMQRMAVSVSS